MDNALTKQELELMFKGVDALLVYMDNLAPEKFDVFGKVYLDVMSARESLKECESYTDRAYLEQCFSVDM